MSMSIEILHFLPYFSLESHPADEQSTLSPVKDLGAPSVTFPGLVHVHRVPSPLNGGCWLKESLLPGSFEHSWKLALEAHEGHGC